MPTMGWILLSLLIVPVGCRDGAPVDPVPASDDSVAAAEVVAAQSKVVRAIDWKVDLKRYAGKWYEIAHYETRFAKGCTATTAEYTLRSDGKLACVNRCRDKTPSGKHRKTEGVGKVVDASTNAKLKFTYYLIFKGDYWIIDLDPDYQWCVVSDPKRGTLFIRSRTREMSDEVYAGILERLVAQGFDPEKIQRTVWPDEGER